MKFVPDRSNASVVVFDRYFLRFLFITYAYSKNTINLTTLIFKYNRKDYFIELVSVLQQQQIRGAPLPILFCFLDRTWKNVFNIFRNIPLQAHLSYVIHVPVFCNAMHNLLVTTPSEFPIRCSIVHSSLWGLRIWDPIGLKCSFSETFWECFYKRCHEKIKSFWKHLRRYGQNFFKNEKLVCTLYKNVYEVSGCGNQTQLQFCPNS